MMIEFLAGLFMILGGVFCLIAGIGIIRMKDIYSRMHAATKAGTLGLALICVGVMIQTDEWGHAFEALIVFLFLIASAPVGAHLIGRAAFRRGNPMHPDTQADPDAEAFRGYGAD